MSDQLYVTLLSLFSCSVMFDPLWPHELQHTSFPCPSLSPRVCSNSCLLSWWCQPTILSSIVPFSCLQSFPASGSFPVGQLFATGGQSIAALASVLPVYIQGWLSLGSTGLDNWPWALSLCSFFITGWISTIKGECLCIKESLGWCDKWCHGEEQSPGKESKWLSRSCWYCCLVAQSCPTLFWSHGL